MIQRRSRMLLMATLALLASACQRVPTAQTIDIPTGEGLELIPNQLIVKYVDDRSTQALTRITPSVEGAIHAESVGFDSADDVQLVRLPKGSDDAAAIARYQQNPRVEWVMQNYRVTGKDVRAVQATSEPRMGEQWYLDRVGAPEAWNTSKGSGVVVAVLDTGVDFTHPDLAGQVINGPNYAGSGDPKDSFGHGTHVAGIIAAKGDNGIGISGVAPAAKVLNIEVLGADGSGSIFGIAKGIKYAADYAKKNHVHVVINMSLGGPARPDPINYLAGKYAKLKGALLVAASGNSNGPVSTPGRLSDFLAVGASTQADQRAPFSNFGPEVGISAPGVGILSTMPTYKVPLNDFKDSNGTPIGQNYALLQGTSMATPIVSGVAALVWSAHPDWTAAQVRERLQSSARDLGAAGKDPEFGSGLVNAAAAVR
ncbi:MAG TPA: S8 family peptidase [Stenomitos sp.]